MKMDILAILMVAFCLFAIGMFILFYIYAKKYHNEKSINDDYKVYDGDDDNSKDEIELVDITINNKDYVFDANGYNLYNYQEVEVVINDDSYMGTVTRGNYKDDINNYIQRPTKLVLKEKMDTNENNEFIKEENLIVDIPNSSIDISDEEFVPIKKNK